MVGWLEILVQWHLGSAVTRGGVVREGTEASVMLVCGIVTVVVFQASHLGCLPVVVPGCLAGGEGGVHSSWQVLQPLDS